MTLCVIGAIFMLLFILPMIGAVHSERKNREVIEKHIRQHREWHQSSSILNSTNLEAFNNIETPLSCDVSTDCSSCDAGCDGGSCGGD